MNTKTTVLTAIIALFLLGSAFGQGALTPPGAPAPTMKSLDQIASTGIAVNAANTPGDGTYPFVISNPGNYYLSGNLNVTISNGSCINITAQGVTLDLNGFQIHGSGGGGLFGHGIDIQFSATNCVVKNGTVTSFSTGINSGARGVTLSHITASSCSVGLQLSTASKAEFCNAHDNQTGINANGVMISHCVCTYNNQYGILTSSSSIRDCSCAHCGIGIDCSGVGGSVIHCDVLNNLVNGISVGSDYTIIGCTSIGNSGTGISVGDKSIITTCIASDNNNGADGIDAGSSCTITGCTATGNSSYGILVASKCTISGCTANDNGYDGFNFVGKCNVTGNTACSNGSNGFHVTGSGTSAVNRIDGNTATSNGGNGILWVNDLVVRNSCFLNGANYNPAVGSNNTGPVQAASSATNPWANF